MNYLVNGLSQKMKRDPHMKSISKPLTEAEFIDLIHHEKFESCIGHFQLAQYLTRITGKTILENRKSIQADYDDLILIVSVKGRLPKNGQNIRYKGNLEYTLVRFEKQTIQDMEKTNKIINEKLIGEI